MGRDPGWATVLSFFVMGLGKIYLGHVVYGLIWFAIQVGLLWLIADRWFEAAGRMASRSPLIYGRSDWIPVVAMSFILAVLWIIQLVWTSVLAQESEVRRNRQEEERLRYAVRQAFHDVRSQTRPSS